MKRILIACIVVLFPAVHADDGGWIDKMLERSKAGHYKMNFDAEMAVEQDGVEGDMTIGGTIEFVTQTTFRVDFDINLDLAGFEMVMETLTVADGAQFWIEMHAPMLGGAQVMKGPVEKLNEMSGANGVGSMGHDPLDQIGTIAQVFDLSLQGVEDGRVTLAATVDPETAVTTMAELPMIESLRELVLVLDEKHAMPVEMRMIGAEPLMTMRFSDYTFFAAADVDKSRYSYTPPEGAMVNDLSEMMP